MPVQAVYQSLNAGFVQVAQVGCCLSRFLAHHEGLGGDETEGVDDNFALDGLDGVDDYGDGTGGELLEGLLRVDVDGGEPAAEAGMGMVPAYYCFWSADLLVWRRRLDCEKNQTSRFAVAYPSSWSERLDPQPRR